MDVFEESMVVQPFEVFDKSMGGTAFWRYTRKLQEVHLFLEVFEESLGGTAFWRQTRNLGEVQLFGSIRGSYGRYSIFCSIKGFIGGKLFGRFKSF